ncbi:Cof-type HAD-IIB family hydrolase [Alkalihalobacillus hemicellulosilyticus]|uniref:Hydrolase n=1 Tax=Halalkalibacter hemicellulosilyticusJCM 9152 TaxID=1236971 RepID=W4QEG9_9BACI|nr:Cof-type HAD-IIB family hydrolase [Halalkalibacter hemicellulosilyticus]GAE30068.1 hypothetical protein JCM9152_1464 [Halalkalibacter hemicellulosilyticusJCM 9152]
MVYKLIALNIDDTIVRANAKITRQTKEAIEYVKAKDVYVTLATSRPYLSAKKIAKALKVNGYLISSDGAFVGSDDSVPVFVRRIFEERALQILDILERYPCHIRVWNEEYAIGNKVKQRNHLIAKMTVGVGDPLFYPVHFVDSVCEHMMEQPFAPLKIQAQFFDDVEQQRALKHLQQISKGFKLLHSVPGRIECVAPGVSKSRSLQRLGDHLQISSEEMVAIGSEEYDIDMLQQVGLGVAMGNANKTVKESADWVTRSIEQNGVAYMIKEVFRKQMRLNV